MQYLIDGLIVVMIILIPRLMILLSGKYKFFSFLGPVFLCYASGFLLSFVFGDTKIAMSAAEILVPIAIPLILFSANLKSLKYLAKTTTISFMLVIVAVLAASFAGFALFRTSVDEAPSISGMLVGLYTGGTPNLMAIGMALGVKDTNIVLANTADMVAGGIYFAMLLSVMPRLVGRFFLPFKSGGSGDESLEESIRREFVPKKQSFSFKEILRRAPVFALSVLSLFIAAGLALLFTGELNVAVVMLVVTTCGIAFSFIKRVRETPGSYAAGQYFIYMFSFAIGLSFDLSLISKGSLMLLVMVLFVQFCSVFLHLLLSRLFGIDGHTSLITSTAGIYGPAFIPPVANALKNREVILPGLICGVFGYAVGNYLGIGLASMLKLLSH
ncbi:MAG: hypothetical protein BWY11_00378 [Firmicutes bacterium ADurb.Bin182]|nr:MAG: hypothetical protein BWY11_00378 [Firmicutes bacterium ADurb.Bin182]